MRQGNKKIKRRRTTIEYQIREFIHGHTDYITACPFAEYGRYTHTLNRVGAPECDRCEYQIKNNIDAMIVRCSHEKQEENEVYKLFGNRNGRNQE